MNSSRITISAAFVPIDGDTRAQLAAQAQAVGESPSSHYALALATGGFPASWTLTHYGAFSAALTAALSPLRHAETSEALIFEHAILSTHAPQGLRLTVGSDGASAASIFEGTPDPQAAEVVILTPAIAGKIAREDFSNCARWVEAEGLSAIEIALQALQNATLPQGMTHGADKSGLPDNPAAPTHWFRFASHHPRTAVIVFNGRNRFTFTEASPRNGSAQPSAVVPRAILRQRNAAQPATLITATAESAADIAAALDVGLDMLRRSASLEEIARVLRGGSEASPCRLAIVARDNIRFAENVNRARASLLSNPTGSISKSTGIFYSDVRNPSDISLPKTVMLFPGQGCQYAGMFREQILHSPTIRAWFERLDRLMDDSGIPRCRFLHTDENGAGLSHQDIETLSSLEGGGICAIAAELGTYELFTRIGLKADVLCGYSNGENAVLFASGMAYHESPDDVFERLGEISRAGLRGARDGDIPMGSALSVTTMDGNAARAVAAQFGDHLAIATDNSPSHLTLFGAPDAIAEAAAILVSQGALCHSRPAQRAYHTKFFAPELPSVQKVIDALGLNPPRLPVISCASADYYSSGGQAAHDMAVHQYIGTVRFRETIERLHADGARTFVELGPGGTLCGFVRQTLASRSHTTIALDRQGRPGFAQLLQAIGQLFVLGADLDWQAYDTEFYS